MQARIIVANELALASVPGPSGTVAFLLTHRSEWIADTASALAAKPGEVIVNPSGGRWIRTDYSDPSWRLGVTDVYINDSLGTNENQGIYTAPQVAPAYITSAEFTRRWGTRGNLVRTGDAVGLEIRLHIRAPIVSPNALDYDVLTDVDTYLRVLGEATTIVRAGLLDATAGFVAQNPNAPGGGTANIIKDAAGGAWNAGELVFFPATGATAYVLLDLGGGSARISEPQTTDEPGFNVIPTTVSIANGAAWQVLANVNVAIGRLSVQSVNRSAFGFNPQNNYADMNISGTTQSLALQYTLYPNALAVFYRCTFIGVTMTPNSVCTNCRAQVIQDDWGPNGVPCGWYGGAIVKPVGSPAGPTFARLSQGLGDSGSLDYGTHIQGGYAYFHALFTAGRFAVWDTAAEIIANPSGHAIIIGSGNSHRLLTGAMGSFRDRGAISVFGNGAIGAGLHLAPGVTVTYESSAVPKITGSRDLQFAVSTVGWWWDETTGNFQPLGPGIDLTWANLVAASSPTGFGGSAHDPDRNIHVVLAA